jgi:hypothetical protein
VREQAFFDAGHEQGRLDGVTESLDSSVKLNGHARAFARRIQVAQLSSKLTNKGVLAVLLELARAFVLTSNQRTESTAAKENHVKLPHAQTVPGVVPSLPASKRRRQ